MRKSVIFLLSIFLLLQTPTLVLANYENPLGNKVGDETVTLEEDEIIDRDYFASGDTVEIYGIVNGDAYVAGGVVSVRGKINGDLLVAGGTLNLAGEVTGDIRAAGGNVTISTNVDGNVTVFGGNIEVTDSATITGSLVGGGGNVIISGPVGKDITFGAGTMTLSNSVGGDVESGVGELRVTSDANLDGDLYYYSEEEADISNSATLSGVIKRNDPVARFSAQYDEEQLQKDAEGFFKGAATTGKIISFTTFLFVGFLIIKLYPNYSQNVATKFQEKTWRSLGFGTLALLLTPILAVVIMITIIGFPLGFVALVFYFLAMYISKMFVMLWAGQFLISKVSKNTSLYLAYLLGLIAYTVLTLVPVVGGIVKFFVLLFSLGAMILTCKDTYKKALENKIY